MWSTSPATDSPDIAAGQCLSPLPSFSPPSFPCSDTIPLCRRWWAEKEIGLQNVLNALQTHSEKFPQQPHLKPSDLLVEAVKQGKSLQETLATRRKN
jgi:hypothetical protein